MQNPVATISQILLNAAISQMAICFPFLISTILISDILLAKTFGNSYESLHFFEETLKNIKIAWAEMHQII
jgi:hypothetical protein